MTNLILIILTSLIFAACGEEPKMKTIMIAGQSNVEHFRLNGNDYMFSDEYAEQLGGEVKVINCAVGGTEIKAWNVGSSLFEDCIKAAEGESIEAVFFYQGETDAEYCNADYEYWFLRTMNGFRERLGAVPIVYAQIAYTEGRVSPCWEQIKQIQAAIKLEYAAMIVTEDIVTLEDWVHIDQASEVRVAQRFVSALKGLYRK